MKVVSIFPHCPFQLLSGTTAGYYYSLTRHSFKGFLLSFLKARYVHRPDWFSQPGPTHCFPQIPKFTMVPPDFETYQRFPQIVIFSYLFKLPLKVTFWSYLLKLPKLIV